MSGQTVNCQSIVNANSVVVNHAHIVQGQPQTKGISPAIVRHQSLKYVSNVSCVDQLSSVKLASNVPNVAQNMGSLWGQTQSGTYVERGLHLIIPNQTKLDQVTQSSAAMYILTGTSQKCSRIGQKSRPSGFLKPAIFGPKTKEQTETFTRSEKSQQIPHGRKIYNGDTRNDVDLPTDREVGHIHRFQ